MEYGPPLPTFRDFVAMGDWNAVGEHVCQWEVRVMQALSGRYRRFVCRCGDHHGFLDAKVFDADRVTGDYRSLPWGTGAGDRRNPS